MEKISKEEFDSAIAEFKKEFKDLKKKASLLKKDLDKDKDNLLLTNDTLDKLKQNKSFLKNSNHIIVSLKEYVEIIGLLEEVQIFKEELTKNIAKKTKALDKFVEDSIEIKKTLTKIIEKSKNWGKLIEGPWNR